MPNVGFFTQDQVRLIFECLETPYSTQYTVLDGMGLIGALTDISNGSTGQAQTQILAFLAAMDTDSATRTIALTVKWDAVSQDTGSLQAGSVGDNAISGITYDFNQKRKRVQELMQIYVPFFKFHEVLARRAGSQNSISIPATW